MTDNHKTVQSGLPFDMCLISDKIWKIIIVSCLSEMNCALVSFVRPGSRSFERPYKGSKLHRQFKCQIYASLTQIHESVTKPVLFLHGSVLFLSIFRLSGPQPFGPTQYRILNIIIFIIICDDQSLT